MLERVAVFLKNAEVRSQNAESNAEFRSQNAESTSPFLFTSEF
jgi:hypothetical protein